MRLPIPAMDSGMKRQSFRPLVSCLALAGVAVACDPPPPEPVPTRETVVKSAAKPTKPGTLGGFTPAAAPAKPKGPFPESKHPALKDPSKATETAPENFAAEFDTTAGKFTMLCHRAWAPHGVDRLYNLVKIGFYNDVAVFRVIKGFMAQFGIHGNPEVSKHWRNANIPADKVERQNRRATVSYAMAGKPTTRATQLFINFGDNSRLDKMGFAPLCEVTKGMENVDRFYNGYGAKAGKDQGNLQLKGNAYLRSKYPRMDYIKTVTLVSTEPEGSSSATPSATPPTSAAPKSSAPKAPASAAPVPPTSRALETSKPAGGLKAAPGTKKKAPSAPPAKSPTKPSGM